MGSSAVTGVLIATRHRPVAFLAHVRRVHCGYSKLQQDRRRHPEDEQRQRGVRAEEDVAVAMRRSRVDAEEEPRRRCCASIAGKETRRIEAGGRPTMRRDTG